MKRLYSTRSSPACSKESLSLSLSCVPGPFFLIHTKVLCQKTRTPDRGVAMGISFTMMRLSRWVRMGEFVSGVHEPQRVCTVMCFEYGVLITDNKENERHYTRGNEKVNG